jgi:uncharacterized damage-inducible protein DinB
MRIDEIRLIYEYNFWADRRILTTCARVSEIQYAAASAHGSLRSTLVHVVSAVWAWRLLLEGNPWPDDLTEADLPTRSDLERRWQVEQQAMRAYLGGLLDEDLNGVVRYPIEGGIVRERVLWHCLLHVVNHGTQHRSEAAMLLTSYGQSPGDLDFTAFLNEYFNLPT